MESFAYGIGNLIGFQLILGFVFGTYLAASIICRGPRSSSVAWIGFFEPAARKRSFMGAGV
jgi:hypothetical protein